jgi:hypothetical protein
MSDLITPPVGFLSPVGNFSRRNTQTLGGVSKLWQDFFASALTADAQSEVVAEAAFELPNVVSPEGEPLAASQWLDQVQEQRGCEIADRVIAPPRALFLPIAEFDTDLLPPAATPYLPEEIQAHQYELDLDTGWRRPLVMANGKPLPEPGPAPRPRRLQLPIAEFEMDLLPPPNEPFDEPTLIWQQREFDFDIGWARPIVLQNLRVTA